MYSRTSYVSNSIVIVDRKKLFCDAERNLLAIAKFHVNKTSQPSGQYRRRNEQSRLVTDVWMKDFNDCVAAYHDGATYTKSQSNIASYSRRAKYRDAQNALFIKRLTMLLATTEWCNSVFGLTEESRSRVMLETVLFCKIIGK